MKKFDYREYLAEGWLFQNSKRKVLKEAKKGESQKDLYKKRADRAEKGNWKGSIGKFVETHGPELGQAYNDHTLIKYVQDNLMPEISDEGKQEVQDMLDSFRGNEYRLLTWLYNVTSKGSGFGGYKAHGLRMEGAEGSSDDDQAWLASLVWDAVNPAEDNGEISGEWYVLTTSDPRIVIGCQGSKLGVSFTGSVRKLKPLESLSPGELEKVIAAAEEGFQKIENCKRQGRL